MRDIDNLSDNFIKEHYIRIGKNVKKAREEKGLSQLKLSQSIGHKSVAIVSQAELCLDGKHFNVEHLLKISYILDVDISIFFKEDV